MSFTSVSFLFLFLPAVIFLYRLTPTKLKKIYLILTSIIFYLWTQWDFLPTILITVIANWSLSKYINSTKNHLLKKMSLGIGIILNTSLLITYKYIFHSLPLGLSFFTFHSISFLVDSYTNKFSPSIINSGVYLLFFPHISAGPLSQFGQFFTANMTTPTQFSQENDNQGIKNIIVGLAKKLVLASSYAPIVDQIFAKNPAILAPSTIILGTILYSLQLYYDFSGYSDIAVGTAQLLGFRLPNNFNYPYIASSINDFWSRWHITLTSWLRRYVYFPLGGSRRGKLRTYLNIIIVFAISGLWHGTGLNYFVWGLWFALFMVIEKWFKDQKYFENIHLPTIFGRLYTLVVVGISWVLFRSESLGYALSYLGSVIKNLPKVGSSLLTPLSLITPYSLVLIIIGIIIASGVQKNIKLPKIIEFFALSLLFLVTLILAASSTYSPFIYTNF